MIADITFGQFFPAKSPIHRMDPRVKLVLVVLMIVFMFLAKNFFGLGVMVVFTVAAMLLSKVPIRLYIKSVKPVLFIIAFTSLINLFYGSGDPLWQFGFLRITLNGIFNAVFIVIRITALIMISALLTFTTSPTQLTDAIERLLKPLSKLHVPVHEFAMMMTIALRFIPTLLEETDKIMSAQKARGADLESGGLIDRVKALIPILIPLFVSAFRRAFDLATAMECRCYHGGEGRTKMKVLHVSGGDVLSLGLSCLACAVVIVCNFVFPSLR